MYGYLPHEKNRSWLTDIHKKMGYIPLIDFCRSVAVSWLCSLDESFCSVVPYYLYQMFSYKEYTSLYIGYAACRKFYEIIRPTQHMLFIHWLNPCDLRTHWRNLKGGILVMLTITVISGCTEEIPKAISFLSVDYSPHLKFMLTITMLMSWVFNSSTEAELLDRPDGPFTTCNAAGLIGADSTLSPDIARNWLFRGNRTTIAYCVAYSAVC